jgi:hypothetical protein
VKTRSENAARREPRHRKYVRLFAYCSVVGVLCGAAALRSAYASMKDSALELGSELGRIGDAGSRTPIRLNGQPIYVSAAVATVPIDELLDRVEAHCRSDPDALAEDLAALPEASRKQLKERLSSRRADGIVRHQGPGRGMVACFMRKEGSYDGLKARFDRLMDFADTGDLSKLGNVRYVYAQEVEDGQTRVVTAWTDGSFNFYSMVPPAGGDAPGTDLEGIPRPTGSVRLLTASADGVPYSVRIYDAPGGAVSIAEQYDREMAAAGWTKVIGGKNPRRVYGRNGVHVYMFPRAEKGRTLVTLLQTRGS